MRLRSHIFFDTDNAGGRAVEDGLDEQWIECGDGRCVEVPRFSCLC